MLCADVVGYSRPMGDNEEATVGVVLLAGGGLLAWTLYQRAFHAALAALEKEAAFPLPDKPSTCYLDEN